MQQATATINQPEFWEKQWESLNAAATPFSGYGLAAVWNAMAPQYGRHHDLGDIDDRIEATLERLESGGLSFENTRVLDVGCGPGRYAAAFARRGARVVAVDISEKMIERLRIEVGPDLLGRITPLVADWKTLDLVRHDFAGSFDLVFANMTPAIATPGSFEKLMRASRRWCWFRAWAGPRENPLQERLYRAIHGTEQRRFSGNFICAWNLACTSGYVPDCTFETIRWKEKKTIGAWSDFYAVFFSGDDASRQAAIRPVIEESLREIAIDGEIENAVCGRIGAMLWTVDRTGGTGGEWY
ncbi:MAG: class I SAM-dependent methyltransferase [Chitinispirillaceae bacterium]|nr:class I SAM-dependent methyltransferase [Chitinispirillaceae bacterium]